LDGVVKITDGFVLYNDTYLCINYAKLKQVLNQVLKLSTRFARADQFATWLRTMFKDYFIYGDQWYCAPLDLDINEILADWDTYMKKRRLEYSLIPEVDCDDYARFFREYVAFKYKTNLLGELWGMLYIMFGGTTISGGHGFNWFIKPLNVREDSAYIWVLIVEPQVSDFTTPNQNGEGVLRYTGVTIKYEPYMAFA